VIFIEINVDKIINAFTKIFFVNVVNVYHIYVTHQTQANALCRNLWLPNRPVPDLPTPKG